MSTNDIYDAVVVGAGLTGALVAHHLAEASLNVVVLEATAAPGGIAGRGAGLALLGTPEFYAALQKRLDADTARHIWELTQHNLALLVATAGKLGQTVTQTGSFRVTDDGESLQQSVTQLKQNLFTVDVAEVTEPVNLTGIKVDDDLTFDPGAMIDALLDHPNITIEYETEVQAVKQTANSAYHGAPLTVWAHKHYIWAKNVILTNGAHAVRLDDGLANVVRPLAMHAVDVQTAAALSMPWVLDDGQVVVQQRDEDICRIVGWSSSGEGVLALVADAAEELCPAATVAARQTWWVAQSEDGLPVVGVSPNTPNVYVVSGLGPWGMSWVFIAVDRLISVLVHGEDPGTLSIARFAAGA